MKLKGPHARTEVQNKYKQHRNFTPMPRKRSKQSILLAFFKKILTT